MKKRLFLIVMMCVGFIGIGVNAVMAGDQGISALEKKLAEALQRIEELEKRVTVTEDIEQIKQLQIRYVTGHTFNDVELEAEGFADDATLEIAGAPIVGKEAILKYAREHAEELKTQKGWIGPFDFEKVPTDGHLMIHPVISVDGDKATGTWMQYALTAEPITMSLLYYIQSIYDVEYVKRNGEWQIYHMKFIPRIQPRSEAIAPAINKKK